MIQQRSHNLPHGFPEAEEEEDGQGRLGLGGPPGEAGADKKRFNGWLNKLNLYSRGSFHLCRDYWGVRKKEEEEGGGRELHNNASAPEG